MFDQLADSCLCFGLALRLDAVWTVSRIGSVGVRSTELVLRRRVRLRLGSEIVPTHASAVGSSAAQSRILDAELTVTPPREVSVCIGSPCVRGGLDERCKVTIHDIVEGRGDAV